MGLKLPLETNMVVTGTRLYEPIRNLCLVSDAFAFATCAIHEMRPPNIAGQGSIMSGSLPRANIVMPYGITFRSALAESEEPQIWVRLTNDSVADVIEVNSMVGGRRGKMSRLVEFHNDAASVQFVMYYERFIVWVKAQARGDISRLEPTWGFARVVRNAIGHAGVISINDRSFKPVTWEGLTYGPDQNGRRIIGSDLHKPDLILLMLEMDQALTEMGYA